MKGDLKGAGNLNQMAHARNVNSAGLGEYAEDDAVDEASEESFPASDAPSTWSREGS